MFFFCCFFLLLLVFFCARKCCFLLGMVFQGSGRFPAVVWVVFLNFMCGQGTLATSVRNRPLGCGSTGAHFVPRECVSLCLNPDSYFIARPFDKCSVTQMKVYHNILCFSEGLQGRLCCLYGNEMPNCWYSHLWKHGGAWWNYWEIEEEEMLA